MVWLPSPADDQQVFDPTYRLVEFVKLGCHVVWVTYYPVAFTRQLLDPYFGQGLAFVVLEDLGEKWRHDG